MSTSKEYKAKRKLVLEKRRRKETREIIEHLLSGCGGTGQNNMVYKKLAQIKEMRRNLERRRIINMINYVVIQNPEAQEQSLINNIITQFLSIINR